MSRRVSPLNLGLEPERVMEKHGWAIALAYLGERVRCPMHITDLSHVPKWSLQDDRLDFMQPAGLKIPERAGGVGFEKDILIIRLHSSECRIMGLGDEIPAFAGPAYTDVTDAFAAFAVVGPHCLEVLGKMSPVDLGAPGQTVPCSAQAPVEDVACLITRIHGRDNLPGLLISVSRGYGHFLLEAFLDAGKEYGLSAAGWERFRKWLGPV